MDRNNGQDAQVTPPGSPQNLPDAGAGAALSGERATECRQRQSNLPILRTNRITGQKYIEVPPRRRAFITLKRPVIGLMAWSCLDGIKFQLSRVEPILENEARAAQTEAGWNDYACGFYGFRCDPQGDGMYVATWTSGGSNE